MLVLNLAFVISLAIISIGCEPTETGVSVFEVDIKNGKIESADNKFEISQGDTAFIKFSADEPFTVFVHGYDIEHNVDPSDSTSLEFKIVGEFTGNFPIHMHEVEQNTHRKGDHDHESHDHSSTDSNHVLISNLIVNPN
jgi:hypothetical protein|tara:strand:- start:1063 stop:1479 length:417 start_codon:yes stop_codon:yes gene_type:complete